MGQMVIDRLSREDAQIFRLGRGDIRGHTCKVMVLERSGGRPLPGLEEIRRRVADRLDAAPRFRRRILPTPMHLATPLWVDDPAFDIARHVTRHELPVSVTADSLRELVAGRMATRLDRAHPLWHLDVVYGPGEKQERMALVWRVHHCLADGTTCIRLAHALLWDVPADAGSPDEERAPATPWQPQPAPNPLRLLGSGLAWRARGLGHKISLTRPRLSRVGDVEAALGRELRRNAARTPMAAPVGAERSVAFASVSLAQARAAGKAIAETVTVNDVLLAILAGAMRRWLGRTLPVGEEIRVKVPVSLHGHDDGAALSNHDSYFFVDLPVNEPDPLERVLAVNGATRQRKLGHDAEVLYHLGLHPAFARWAMSPRMFTFNVSNVPGPRGEVTMLGARLSELYSLAEIAQRHALRVAVISAAGRLFFGLCADRQAVKDLPRLAEALDQSAAELLGPTAASLARAAAAPATGTG